MSKRIAFHPYLSILQNKEAGHFLFFYKIFQYFFFCST